MTLLQRLQRRLRNRFGPRELKKGELIFGERWPWLRTQRTARLKHAIDRGDFAEREILAVALFGLGNRLKRLLLVMQAADALRARFVFYWPMNDVAGVHPAEKVFDPEFLRRHLIAELPEDQVRVSGNPGLKPNQLLELRRRQDRVLPLLTLRGTDVPLKPLHELFKLVQFHPRLESVREYVERELPRFALGIHIRRGDSFMGDNRIGGKFIEKHVPLPVIRRALDSQGGDRQVLLVGEAMQLIRGLASKPWIHSLEEYRYPGETAPDRTDFFDFMALTRCDRILAGTSHFAVYPALLGGGTLVSPMEHMPVAEIGECLMSYIQNPLPGDDPLEVALSCEFAFRFCLSTLPVGTIPLLLKAAFRVDPGNPTYSLRIAADFLRDGDASRAGEVLGAAVQRTLPTALELARKSLSGNPDINFKSLMLAQGFLSPAEWDLFNTTSGTVPWLDYFVGLRCIAERREEDAAAAFARAESTVGATPAWFDHKSFVQDAHRALVTVQRWT